MLVQVVRRTALSVFCAAFFWTCGLQAQDAGLALSTMVSYNTQRASLKLTPEQAKEAERLGREANQASREGHYAAALRFYAQGAAVMNNVEWTPDVEFASALRGSLDHAMISGNPEGDSRGAVTVLLKPLFTSDRIASAKLSATTVLMRSGQEIANLGPKAAIDPAKSLFTEKVEIPAEPDGNYIIQVRLTEANDTAPAALHNVFVKDLPIHIEPLEA